MEIIFVAGIQKFNFLPINSMNSVVIMRLGWELSYSEKLTKPKDLRNPDAPQNRKPLTGLEKLYIRVFGMPDTVKQQQARVVFRILAQLKPFSSVLDVGCAQGHYSIRIAREYPHSKVKGVDVDEEKLNVGKQTMQNFGLSNLTFEERDVFESWDGGKYDVVLLLQVIEHLEDDATGLKKIGTMIKKDGHLIITGPNIESPSIIKYVNRYVSVLGHYRDGYKVQDLVKMVKEASFRVERVERLSGSIGELSEKLETYFQMNLFPVFPLLYPFIYCLSLLDDHFGAKDEKQTSGILIVAQRN